MRSVQALWKFEGGFGAVRKELSSGKEGMEAHHRLAN
jgi:hypothetical protein